MWEAEQQRGLAGGWGVDLDPTESIVSLILQGTLECRLCLRVVPASAKEAGLLDPCTRQSLALQRHLTFWLSASVGRVASEERHRGRCLQAKAHRSWTGVVNESEGM